MTSIIKKTDIGDYLLVCAALVNNEIDKNASGIVKGLLKGLADQLPLASFDYKGIEKLRNGVSCITAKALNRGLYFRVSKPLALISGAGISGLAASFELRAKGFNVVIAEKRKDFSRLNIVNLSVETQAFLKKFHLLEKFEKFVAARIQEHRYVLIGKDKSGECPKSS
jgi:hypothetical protein